MKFFQEKLSNIYQLLQTDSDSGLSEQQVKEIRQLVGSNVFEEEKKETVWQKILHHLKDLTSLILLTAAAISLFLAITEGHGFAEPIVILSIVIIDTILAVYQEMDAERALEALKSLHAQMTVVLREGRKQTIDATELVPGDIIVLEAGDSIPADARLIESINLKVEESVLTGESVPAEKDAQAEIDPKAQLGDQLNMLFSGCLITNGRAKAVVVETGMRTEMGKIAGMLNNTARVKTPLQKRMIQFAKLLTAVAVISAVILFVIQLSRGEHILNILLNAVALAVAAV
ncbi:MAG: HAD-IC family P-type ATPase, partial [Clostridiales bacterium]|nr:HAD-IC family P-type ATPase [Clostridiales bacterium]